MIEFIICDDNKVFLNSVVNLINKIMLKKKVEYRIKKFYDFDNSFLSYIDTTDNMKIYILDIETPTRSGISIGRLIRKRDLKSPIIYLTGHEELSNLILRKDISFLAFINKFEDFEYRLAINIDKALKMLAGSEYLSFEESGVIYHIEYDKILYFTRDSVARKTVIVTDNREYKVFRAISDIEKDLGNNFLKTHRSCIINKNRAEQINYKKKFILFDNGVTIDLISNNFR